MLFEKRTFAKYCPQIKKIKTACLDYCLGTIMQIGFKSVNIYLVRLVTY